MTRLLVTGATGNVGTALLRRLADEPELEIIGAVRRRPPAQPPYDRATWHTLDVSTPETAAPLAKLMAGVDVVVHLVWAFQPTRDPDYLRRVAVDGTSRVLAAAEEAGVGHFVHMSSVGAYAPKSGDRPVNETYPHTGMPTSLYSTHKAEVESLLDHYENTHPDGMTITRVRPGIVLQRDAGAALSRYFIPGYLPVPLLRLLPVLPLDRGFAVPVVHADDLADAVARIIARRAGGAFNVAADAPMTRADVAAVLGAHPVHLPAPVLRSVVGLSWRMHLQPLSPGWLDLAFAVPLQDTARARSELGWTPGYEPRAALADAVTGMVNNSGTASPSLRPRSVVQRLQAFAGSGPISKRTRP